MVDYLQLLRAKAENRQQEITAVSRDCKEASKALGKISGGTLIATAQLSRIKDRPKLEDLRESGQIEQDADVVMMISNKDKTIKLGTAKVHQKFLSIVKQRNGPLRTLLFDYIPPYLAFEPGVKAEGSSGEEDDHEEETQTEETPRRGHWRKNAQDS